MDNKLILSSALLALTAVEANAQIEKQPNIIWLMAEDMGLDLSCYGMQAVSTPTLDSMASQGVQYNSAYCTSPISSPNRSAMLTGVNQTTINAHNHRSNRDVPLTADVKPITYYLREAGYTCILGNTNVMNKGRKIDCNFKTQPLGTWDGVENFGLFDKYDEITPEDQPFFAQIQLVVTHRGDWWKEISAKSDDPVDPNEVVMPPFLPDHIKVREDWARYLDQVEYMDSEIQMILDELQDKGVLDNTIIFFIGDNGRCNVKGKGYLYDSGLRVPMIAWGKGLTQSEVNDIVSTIDISATILDLAGCELPEYMMGKPLFDKESGNTLSGREDIYSARDNWDEVIECIRSVTTTKYRYLRNYMPQQGWDMHQQYLDFYRPAIHVMRILKAEGKLADASALFMADTKSREELYDIVNDPFELNNLAYDENYSAVLKDLQQRMDKWQSEHNDIGLEDMYNRTPEEMGEVREFVMKNYPEEWEAITKGEACIKYHTYKNEYAKSLKK